MPQGWYPNASTDVLTFYEAPPVGANNIVVNEFAAGAVGGTDVFALGAWSNFYGYPREIEFFGDRLFLASTPADSQAIWGSCIGDYTNFGRSSPIVDSDSVSFVINSRQVNTVKDLVPLDNLLILTTASENKMTGGADDVITPSTIGVKNQGNSGTGDVPAKVIGESAIFVQEEGQKIRDLGYQFEKDGFRGNEISIWAEHLFYGYTIENVAHWKAPWSVLIFTRDDGVQVGCTYLPEQEVVGFHWHDTDGKWMDSSSLPGKKESELYALSQRVIDGETVQYIEQQETTRFATESDMVYMDAAVTYDGRNTTATTVGLSTGGGWTEYDLLTITASASIFTAVTDIGDAIRLTAPTGESVQVIIDAYTSGTVVQGYSVGTVPAVFRTGTTTSWTFQRDTIGGLWHLEGKMVSVLRDAAVAGPFLVEDGQITLDTPGGVVHVGLGYVAQVETLELNSPGNASLRDQNKLAFDARVLLLASRGVYAYNPAIPGDEGFPVEGRQFENYGQPPFLKSGQFDCKITAGWGVDNGRVGFRQTDPLPMEILSITTKAAASGKL